MVKFKSFYCICLILLCLSFLSCSSKNRISYSCNDVQWKYTLGDNMKYASNDYDDSSWSIMKDGKVDMDESHFCWVRATLQIPSELRGKKVYLGSERTNSAYELYSDGVLFATRGSLPPNQNVRIESTNDFLIPENFISEDGKVQIAMRVFAPSSKAHDLELTIDNENEAWFENVFHNIFNQRMFLILTFISAFIAIYTFGMYLGNRKNSYYLWYSLSCLTIAIYFYNIACEIQILSFNLQQALSRAFLPISLCFMTLFLNRFFNRKKYKAFIIFTIIVSILSFGLYFTFMGKENITELIFNIMLLPVVVTIVYGFISSIQGIKEKIPYSIIILVGFSFGVVLAMHDIVYSVVGKVPFMWTQALAFASVDIAVFITLVLNSMKEQKNMIKLAKKTEEQRQKLENLFENARNMVNESNRIAEELTNSIRTVKNVAETSTSQLLVINKEIRSQTDIQADTTKNLSQLTEFLANMEKEFDSTSEHIKTTADKTQETINGITTVNQGISIASSFSTNLNALTEQGSSDIHQLMQNMELIQESSKKVLSVAATLDNFAQQTDLLSMNASIEAAHSGIAGKGFSVIAHEIKNLAAQSSAWATKIGEIIKSVISDIEKSASLTEKVMETFDKINEGATQSAKTMQTAAESIKKQLESGHIISEESRVMAESAIQMKDSVSIQNSLSNEVIKNMENLTNASAKVDNASADIFESSKILTQQVSTLSNLADRTKEAAESLKLLLEKA